MKKKIIGLFIIVLGTPIFAQSIIEITPTQLFNEYKNNQIRADSQYKGKRMKITGQVIDIREDMWTKAPVIFFGVDADQLTLYFKNNTQDRRIVSNLNKGDTITFIGTCMGWHLFYVYFENVTILER